MLPLARSLRFEPLEDRRLLAATTIKVLAAGSTGSEQFDVAVAKPTGGFDHFTGTVTQVLTPARTFQTFTFTVPYAATVDNVTVSFTNDGRTAAGADRNLTVDGILVGATKYESESPSTNGFDYYDPINDQNGGKSGYFKRETLYGNGYFAYSSNTSTITVRAAGSTHTETTQLLIDEAVVATFNNIAGNYDTGQFATYSFTYGGSVDANRVRVAFINDGLTPAGVDRNLRVDSMSIRRTTPNGTTDTVYQTEANTVFSTGVFMPGRGAIPGRWTSEYLQNNGFFQYGFALGNSWVQILAAGSTGTETIRLAIAGKNVATYQNVGGNYGGGVFQSFFYLNSSVRVFPSDVRVKFINDGTNAAGVDRNIRVDAVVVDGAKYQTEAPDTYVDGLYVAGQGRTAGFLQTEYLHLNGYFQYQAIPPETFTASPISPGNATPTTPQFTLTKNQTSPQSTVASPVQIFTTTTTAAAAPANLSITTTKKASTPTAADKALALTLAWL